MKKSYSALIQPSGAEINQFATISADGQVLLWEKKFLDNQKKLVTDVFITLCSIHLSIGKLATVSICSDLKEEELWEDPLLLSIKIKRKLSSLVQLIKVNFLFVIGPQDQLEIKVVAKMIQLLPIGIKKEVLDQW